MGAFHAPAYAAPAYHHAPLAATTLPAYGGYAAPASGATRVLPAAYGSPFGHNYGSTFGSFAAGQAAARNLDAADGVIDGKHFGSTVVARH
eukprot:NODE_6567_length_446_cov_402.269521_g5007_i0.p1 GENE.NODE_6567_length_446_cov_402.269521_g5007_i0~~NODE_6567_length_446_cov_402.269521_g5007_i0.p1  ORF type:complete len:101 (-),score=61.88 NODE_6567_length_446_cov_402.269521_g5007_i0:143-415(-)